jgi:hypothetical protein
MKARDLLFYLAIGAVLGALAGAGAAKSLEIYSTDCVRAFGVMVLSGAILSAAGAASAGSKRSAWREPLAGLVLSGLGFSAFVGSGSASDSGPQIVLIFFSFLFAGLVAASHALSLRERNAALAAGFFGGIGGLLALAAAMWIIVPESFVPTYAAAGAVYGGLMWFGAGLARVLFSVDVDKFRV